MRKLNDEELSMVSGGLLGRGDGTYASSEATFSNILNCVDVDVLAISDIVDDVNILNED